MGLLLAMAGNAIGLGNYIRFPGQAAQNGGGAFMIPYVSALVLVALPLMWCEYAMGRMGGERGHGTTPGMLTLLWDHPLAKYIGTLGVFGPLVIAFYYVYVQSWTLAFSYFALTQQYAGITTSEGMVTFLADYQGTNTELGVTFTAYVFFLLAMALNVYIILRGVPRGIEIANKWGIPAMLLLSMILVVRVLTLGTPDPSQPANSVWNGLGFIWNPEFSQLSNAKIWLAAAGQIFFSTSVGIGAIQCYASYMKPKDDVVVAGLSTIMINQWGEVIMGGTIAIPIAFAFFGAQATTDIAGAGAFNLAFTAMPVVLQRLPLSMLFGTCWFFLLFIAGTLAALALMQPAVSFLEDELRWTHNRSAVVASLVVFIAAHVPILGNKHGALGEIDFWAATFGLSAFALLESIIVVWIFKAERMWVEIHRGADAAIPRIFLMILKYVTPLYLMILFLVWTAQDGTAVMTMKDVPAGDVPWRWLARMVLVATLGGCLYLVYLAWHQRGRDSKGGR